MSELETYNPNPIFRGTVQNAIYKDQSIARYRDNPILEALPVIRPASEVISLLTSYPELEPDGSSMAAEVRTHLIMDVLHFFQPLPVHIDLEQRVSRVLRDGYISRDPRKKEFWLNLDQTVETILKCGGIPYRSSNTNGFSIIGIPGGGKTSAIERVLQLYSQVIYHTMYKGMPFNRVQLVWLKLTCPPDGTIKGLATEFFRVVDGVLDTRYSRDYVNKSYRTVDDLISAMARVASIHCLGLLVIDEIQHLNEAKSGGAERMLNFFLQLMNTLGLPIITVGTYAAMAVLSRELRQIRRSSGQGDLIWDVTPNDEVWRLLMESLWRYQYTRVPVPLTDEIVNALHYESAGILDFAIKLFLLTQIRAITVGAEKITTATIHSVAHDSLRLAQPALRAIRTGDTSDVSLMRDLNKIDFPSAVQQIRKSTLLQTLSVGSRAASDVNAAAIINAASEANPEQVVPGTVPDAPPKTSNLVKPRKSRAKGNPSKCLLVQLVDAGVSKGISPYDALANAGLILPFPEFSRPKAIA